ncbi:MAG: alpha/beta hydrolase fold domain-containing protein [Planctomycetota bacterium]
MIAGSLSAQEEPSRAAGPVAERFRQLDRDGDGALSREELPMAAAFERLDADSNGEITREEAAEAFRQAAPEQRQRWLRGLQRAAAPAAAEGIKAVPLKTSRDLRYKEDAGVEVARQSLDIYAPENAKDLPVMVYVHGGGWRKGDKQAVAEKPTFFAGRGFVFVSINYRLLPKGQHPANVEDVAAALAWLHDHVAEYGGDPTRMFLMGHSAGAHLVALVGTDDRRLKAFGKDLSILKGVIPNDTQAYDVPRVVRDGGGTFYPQVFGKDTEVWRDASPLTHVAKGKSIPPFLIIHNMVDSGESRAAQAKAFAEALESAGSRATVVAVPDRTHGELNQWLGRPDERTTQEMVKFLDEVLGAKKPSER